MHDLVHRGGERRRRREPLPGGGPVPAVGGRGASRLITGAGAAAVPVPDWSPWRAAMMGRGIGVGCALVVVARLGGGRGEGLDPEKAGVGPLDRAGRSEILAGSTRVIS